MKEEKEKYRVFCSTQKDIPIFITDWWLDAVCEEERWDVALVEDNNRIIAALPYYTVKAGFFRGIKLPPFTPTLGPYVYYPDDQKYGARLSYEKEVFNKLIDKLPRFDFFTQSFSPEFTNWLPFYWRGFLQTTKYTYILDDLSDISKVLDGFSYAKQKNLKRSEKSVVVDFNCSAGMFYDLHKASLAGTGQKINYSFELFDRIHKACIKHDSGTILLARDEEQNVHGALFIVWDRNATYDLVSAFNPSFRSYGSSTLLVKEAIKFAAGRSRTFDFEGSMIENVENSFRQFGTRQVPYFKLMKYNSLILKIIKGIRHTP